ncbi:hypothetical protein JCM19037_2130 [Geomicrobium sp. JCM 19037]|nr:hypothetical protein JCM19037_2130 [Geomicrobium sp. JCM 19037]
MKKWLVASSFLLLLTACGTDDEGTADEPQDDSDQDTVEETEDMDDDEGDDDEGSTVLDENDEGVTVLAEDLETPWNIEENDGTFYITERSTGEIVHVTEDSQESYPVEFSDELYTEIEAGLMGMALAPDFDETNEAFIYYTYGDEDEAFNKVARVAFDEEEGVWTEEDVLLDEIPGFRIHSGGRIAIGPDDLLYVGVGDVDEIHGQEGDTEGAMIAQDEDSYAGSILRMNLMVQYQKATLKKILTCIRTVTVTHKV